MKNDGSGIHDCANEVSERNRAPPEQEPNLFVVPLQAPRQSAADMTLWQNYVLQRLSVFEHEAVYRA